jgi:hypothetical protein
MAGPTPWILDSYLYGRLWFVFGRFRDQILIVRPDCSDIIPVFLMTSCEKVFKHNITFSSAIIIAFSGLAPLFYAYMWSNRAFDVVLNSLL